MKRIWQHIAVHFLLLLLIAMTIFFVAKGKEFQHPGMLLLLFVLPLLSIIAGFTLQSQSPVMRTTQLSMIRVNPIWAWLRYSPVALRYFAWTFLCLALARPQSSSSFQDMHKEGIDIVLSMDISVSMLSQDFKPNRLESSKKTAVDFVKNRPDDRIGVVVYEGESYTQVPLTSDHQVVTNALRGLESGQIQGGTAIGLGLGTAVNRLRNSEAKSKVVILLTDGVNNAGQIKPIDAARIAKAFDIRVYTIGVGTKGKAKSPVAIDRNGRYIFDYTEVKIDEEVLKEIAGITGGEYFRATSESKLKEIYEQIDTLEKTRFNVTTHSKKSEKFAGFLWIAIILLIGEFVVRQTWIRS